MRFFSGFCLNGEEGLFSEFLPQREACIAGFSYGATKALEYALNTNEFFKKLVLLSPAFYEHTTTEFRQVQLENFKSNPELYALKLMKKSGLSEQDRDKYGQMGTYKQLEELLNYKWSTDGLEKLLANRVEIEIYIGSDDRVVDPHKSMEFFKNFGTVYFIKNKNHCLR